MRKNIAATDLDRDIITRRATEAEKARNAANAAEQVVRDVFAMFCTARGIPTTAQLVGIKLDTGEVIIELPDETASGEAPAPDAPPADGKVE
jgi:hypothetical protein